MADKDKPKVNFSFSQFEDVDPAPYVYVTRANKRVTFPDIFAMEAEEAEKFLLDISDGNTPDSKVLERWLEDDDYQALRDDKLTLRHRQQLIEQVQSYYDSTFGSQGEGAASAS